jgi:hypothetical protein
MENQTGQSVVACGSGSLKGFSASAVVFLIVTGAAKVWTAFGNVKLLTVADPIVGISFKHLMLVVGLAEIVIALVCFFSKRQTLALALVAWLATNFVVYRFSLSWIGWKKPCNCLGNLTDALHISPQAADNIMKVVLAYLLIGSYGLLIWQWREARRRRAEDGGQTPGTGLDTSPSIPLPVRGGEGG